MTVCLSPGEARTGVGVGNAPWRESRSQQLSRKTDSKPNPSGSREESETGRSVLRALPQPPFIRRPWPEPFILSLTSQEALAKAALQRSRFKGISLMKCPQSRSLPSVAGWDQICHPEARVYHGVASPRLSQAIHLVSQGLAYEGGCISPFPSYSALCQPPPQIRPLHWPPLASS